MDISQNDESRMVSLPAKSHSLKQTHKSQNADLSRRQEEQQRQTMKVAHAEIEELKESLGYVEMQLAKGQEEKEALENKVSECEREVDVRAPAAPHNFSEITTATEQADSISPELGRPDLAAKN